MQRTLIKPNENKHILDKDSEDWLSETCAQCDMVTMMKQNVEIFT